MEPEPRGPRPATGAGPDLLGRTARAVGVLVSAHVTLARAEARADAARIVEGALMVGSALALLAIATVLAHAALVVAAHAWLGWGWVGAIGAVATMDTALAAALASVGRARLTAPLLVQTRARLVEATAPLREQGRDPASP